ncbi:hypothetical protein BC827DRAFT_1262767 [Russula dissimulans]|nr:hypothetical protein BC827DRAFT_1262767 [Russula dissimulans]
MDCPACYQGFILPGEPNGSMVGLGYFTPAPPRRDATERTKAIVFLTDIFGISFRSQRDDLLKTGGVRLVFPDLIHIFEYLLDLVKFSGYLPVLHIRTPSARLLVRSGDVDDESLFAHATYLFGTT